MAKTISDEKIKLSIIIDGNPAQQELLKLEKATGDLNKRQKELREEKAKLERQGKKETEQYKSLTEEIKQNTVAITANKNRMSDLQNEIGLTGLTMAQLQQKATGLRAALRNAVPGGEAYQRYNAELTQVNGRLDELRGRSQSAGSSIGNLADKFNRYAGLAASAVAVGTGVVLSLQKMIDYNAKLSDAQTNVQKTTGMTKKEVDELTKSFGMFQTRTSRINLLGIAETGGRLGIAKNEIQDFVKVMDKAAVALGDSFEGGPEVVADKLGKIKGLYEELKNTGVEVAFESVGSALNELGAAGTASEGNVAEFVTRVGAMPEAFKPSIAEALGLGAAFEESGIKAEVAAGNYSKVIGIAANNVAGFAQVMKRPKEELEKLINTNPNEFFLQFASSLKGLDATQLAKVLDYLKLNDNEVKQVLGAASQNVQLFRDKINLANQSLNEGTSLTNEFNTKNANLAATLEKLQKKIVGAFSSETVVNWLASAAEGFAKLIGATEDTEGSMQVWRNTLAFVAKMIAVVTAALITNVAWQKLVALWTTRNTEATALYNIATRARAIADGISTVATQTYAAATMLLRGNIAGATQAFRIMATTMKTTPWGLILGMVAAAVTAYAVFAEKAEKLTKVQKLLADVNSEAAKSIVSEKAELERLTKIAKDETISKEKRKSAIEALNKIIPDYIGNLSLENIKTMEGTNILKKYTEELYRNAKAKAAQAKFDELAKQRIEVEGKSSKDYRSGTKQFLMNVTGQSGHDFTSRREVQEYVVKTFGEAYGAKFDKKGNVVASKNAEEFKFLLNEYLKDNGILDKETELSDIDAQMKALEDTLLQKTVNELNVDTATVPTDLNIPEGKDKKTKKEKYDDSYLKDEQASAEALYQVWKKNQEAKIALMQDGYEKELALENFKTAEVLRENYKRHDALMALENQIQKDIEVAEKVGDTKKVTSLRNQMNLVKKEREELGKQIEYEESMHQLRVGTIQEKAGREEVEKTRVKYDQEKNIRETAFLEELAVLNLSEEEKAKRKEVFAKEEAKREMEFLTKQLKEYENMLNDVDFNGIDFSLLSPEAEAKLQEDIEKLRLAIAKLKEAQGTPSGDAKEIDLGMGGETDILGFSQTQWENFFKNIEQGTIGFQTMSMAVGAMQNLYAQFDKFLTANENAQLKKYEKNSDAKKRRLKQQLDSGYINQAQYKKGVEQIDQEYAKKKAELEYRQAKRQKMMALTNAIIGTAQAVINGANTQPFFPLGIAMMALAGIMGGLQIATIAKQPLPSPGYEKGLYPDYIKREQDGKLFKASFGGYTRSGVVDKPTHFLAGENGPEMIIDSKAYSQLSPETRNALLREIRGIKGFETGYYKNNVLHTGNSETNQNTSSASDNDTVRLLLNVVAENTAVIKDLRDSGIMAVVSSRDMKSMKELKDGLKKYDDLRNKNIQ